MSTELLVVVSIGVILFLIFLQMRSRKKKNGSSNNYDPYDHSDDDYEPWEDHSSDDD